MDKKIIPEDVTLDNIHTLNTDTVRIIQEQKLTQEKLLAQQQEEENRIKQEREARNQNVKKVHTHKIQNIIVLLSLFVALIGISFTLLNFINKRSQTTPVTPSETEQTLVSFESKKEIILSLVDLQTGEGIKSKLISEAISGSEGVVYYKTNPTVLELIPTLSPSIPGTFLRTIIDVFYGGLAQGNFLLLKTDSYERSYASMLEWEPNMSRDMVSLFGSTNDVIRVFQDKVIENKDTRVLYDDKGQILFLYGFYNENIIIFAKNEEVFRSVFNSLLRQNL